MRSAKWYEKFILLLLILMVLGCLSIVVVELPKRIKDSAVATSSDAVTSVVGFLTLDGTGISDHPFDEESAVTCEWHDNEIPEFTALPLYVYGILEDNVLYDARPSVYQYELGTNDEADAYYTVIAEGWQEGIEDLFVDIYTYLNEDDTVVVDGTILSTVLSSIHGDEKYGYLQDILTEALAICKSISDGEKSEELNQKAAEVYNDFYGWLYDFNVDKLLGENLED